MSLIRRALALVAIASTVTACATQSSSSPAGSQQGLANVQVPAAVRSLATNPQPPADAKPATGIGSGPLGTSTTDSPGDKDWIWAAQIDVTGDGQVEDTQILWDDEDKILLLSSAATFACTGGGEGAGTLLIGLYGAGNTDQQPVGSGVWAVQLDESECSAEEAGIFGCAFDANGNPTGCGIATLDQKTGELDIAAAGS